jgi:hypothetical protein
VDLASDADGEVLLQLEELVSVSESGEDLVLILFVGVIEVVFLEIVLLESCVEVILLDLGGFLH